MSFFYIFDQFEASFLNIVYKIILQDFQYGMYNYDACSVSIDQTNE